MPPKSKISASAAAANNVAVGIPIKPDNRVLPTKEQGLFRNLLQLFEQKEYKKGMKITEQLLKNYPEHGETIAMKAILLHNSTTDPKLKEEAYELIKKGVRNDLKSHIVWHIYGLMHRADKNYEEAMKCYVQANRIEANSLNILNDLAFLSIHLRRYDAYVLYRHTILRAQPRVRRHWIGLAVAQHLARQYAEADTTLRHYEEMLTTVPENEYDFGEILMYHATILEEWGEFEKCLEFLSENSAGIVDKSAFTTMRGRLLIKVGRTESAVWAWSLLLEENPDSYEYIKACVSAKGADYDSMTVAGKAAAVAVLDGLAESHPKSLAVRRLALEIVSGEQFQQKAARYLTDALSKGIPSLFADMKSLYTDVNKSDRIGALVQKFRESLEVDGKFGVVVEGDSADTVESSAAYLWTLYFLAQHHSTLCADSFALTLINLAIGHTPSLPELWMLKARILKRGGDTLGALAAMTEATGLDGQDRFLNSKRAKYLLRADFVEEAEVCVGLFTKKEATSPLDDLVEMQCLWLLQEEGDSYSRRAKYALALKRYQQIFAVFAEVEDDQFDFHGYCLRKYTLRSYVDLLKYTDELRSHPGYYSAAKGAITIYLQVHDDPSTAAPLVLTNSEAETAVEAAEEKKKADSKAKKIEAKDKGKKSALKKAEDEIISTVVVDQDPVGELLLSTKEPLVEALKWLRPLEKSASGVITTWLLSYEVAIRRHKYLQALHALRTARSIDPHSALLHHLIVRFALLLPTLTDLAAAVSSILNKALTELLMDLSIEAFNSSLLQTNSGDAESITVVAKGLVAIRGAQESKEEVEALIFLLSRAETSHSIQASTEGVEVLRLVGSSRIDELKQVLSQRYSLASAFKLIDHQSNGSEVNGDAIGDAMEKEEIEE